MTENDLTDRRVLAIVTNYGVEQDELVVPVRELRESGAEVAIAAPSAEPIRTLVSDKDPGVAVEPTLVLTDVDPAGYDLLLVPGGTLNADSLRLNDTALAIVRSFTTSGRPVAAICHGPWLLVEADVVRDRTLTSYPSVATDIRNAGGRWLDESVVRDDTGDFVMITSRNPGDIKDFLGQIETILGR
ncbi:type 1 glutamine amidotransferase domain-containing protein [Embleya sp. MST-111070]|uniref:type 1 glutamine amidotransferase domain-containing protein n=1 Tax=Embleya sp. MST-111070 TaxID=3398231 RepID=UPI003F735027